MPRASLTLAKRKAAQAPMRQIAENAASVAGLLITTEAIVGEHQAQPAGNGAGA